MFQKIAVWNIMIYERYAPVDSAIFNFARQWNRDASRFHQIRETGFGFDKWITPLEKPKIHRKHSSYGA